MCGIFGSFNGTKSFKIEDVKEGLEYIMLQSLTRGKEASGLFAQFSSSDNAVLIKTDLDSKKFVKSDYYNKFIQKIKKHPLSLIMGHTRLATNGSQLSKENNQPVVSSSGSMIGIHNGIITNTNYLSQKYAVKQNSLDTKVLIDFFEKSFDNNFSVKKFFQTIEGSASFAFYYQNRHPHLLLGSNTGSLYYTVSEDNSVFFASEKIYFKNYKSKVHQVKPGNIIAFEKDKYYNIEKSSTFGISQKFDISCLSPQKGLSLASKFYKFNNRLTDIKKHRIDEKQISNIKRCTKCILPETTPFISFDKKGVCNFCQEHEKIKTKGLESLKKIADKIRSKDGSPDCMAGFSGGRDSSYGLHFLKRELGLTPIAYTYDWGMITDLGRRNQARVLGKLGVEHLVVSADITKKRKDIRSNVKAWLKDPHLGMVPIFMQGDKQCEYYANKLMEDYKIQSMFFFRGNELEREEFKNGHCGIKDADPNGIIHDLEFTKKIKLLAFYAYRYLKNPSYFNPSFFDVSLAYYSTYIQKHNYLYLWHFIPWEEKKIISTLKSEYNWETPEKNPLTWRTDDGSSAFYNYIYYQVQGFTENDSFRSRQIREGLINRLEALQIVQEENRPRYDDLKWYFDNINLNASEVLSVVDSIEKLY